MVRMSRCLAATLTFVSFAMAGGADAQGRLPTPPVTDTLAQRMSACTPCHGEQGRATPGGYFPRIAGKPAAYLSEQLRHFRDGRRLHGAMTGMVQHLSDDYLREIAAHFAALELPYAAADGSPVAPPLAERGRTLVERGDPVRELPACRACHGERLTGTMPATPGLIGLPREYVTAQLEAWRNGTRRAASPDCMALIARRLADEDVQALARWLAALPPREPMAAVAPSSTPTPLRCGSGAP